MAKQITLAKQSPGTTAQGSPASRCTKSCPAFTPPKRQSAAFPRRDASEFLPPFRPRKREGAGKRRVPAAPAASCARVVGRAHTSIQVHRNTRHSLRNGFKAYILLSPVTAAFATVIRETAYPARSGRSACRELDARTGASGPQGFAVRVSVVRPARCRRSRETRPATHRAPDANSAHRIPPQRSRRWPTPLWRDRMGDNLALILFSEKQNYFYRRSWTKEANQCMRPPCHDLAKLFCLPILDIRKGAAAGIHVFFCSLVSMQR
jgi:hypothetical protein